MQTLPNVEPSCAICGAPPVSECVHEPQRLKLAVDQAWQRWSAVEEMRKWVLDHARLEVISTFEHFKAVRREQYMLHLQTLPYYGIYSRSHGAPPIHPAHLHQLHMHIEQAQLAYKAGIDEDWRRSCLRYPEVLDHYFNLIDISYPPEQHEEAAAASGSRVGGRDAARHIRDRRSSSSLGRAEAKERRRREKRRSSRARSPEMQVPHHPHQPPPPPVAPMPGHYRR